MDRYADMFGDTCEWMESLFREHDIPEGAINEIAGHIYSLRTFRDRWKKAADDLAEALPATIGACAQTEEYLKLKEIERNSY